MGIMSLIEIVLGAVEATVLHKLLGYANVPDTSLIGQISARDLAVLGVGVAQVMFGGRISPIVRNMGYGVVAGQVFHETKDFVWSV